MTIHVSKNTIVVIAIVALGAGTLALKVGVPLGNMLWIALVLACPLMMMFMMGGGHGHGGADHNGHDRRNTEYPRGVH